MLLESSEKYKFLPDHKQNSIDFIPVKKQVDISASFISISSYALLLRLPE